MIEQKRVYLAFCTLILLRTLASRSLALDKLLTTLELNWPPSDEYKKGPS